MTEAYLHIINLLAWGYIDSLEEAEKKIESFPNRIDGYLHCHWVNHAVSSGFLKSIRWMLSKGVDLSFRDDAGGSGVVKKGKDSRVSSHPYFWRKYVMSRRVETF